MSALRAVIVEDQPAAARALEMLLGEYCPEVEILGQAAAVPEAVRLIRDARPDLVFLDIGIRNGSGFDLLDILPGELSLQIIFTTGSSEHAARAFRYSALDYLLKPVDPSDLVEAVRKAGRKAGAHTITDYQSSFQRDRLALHSLDRIELVPLGDILFVSAEGNYSRFHLGDGRELLVSQTLRVYDERLAGGSFVRVHQSYLVNFARVQAFLREEGGYLVVDGGKRVPVAHRKKALVMQFIDQYL